MSQDKEEYDVGIPLDDLSPRPSATDGIDDHPEEAPAVSEHDHSLDEEDDGIGLPSLFDEDELAEVGLKASPFSDNEDAEISDEGPSADTDADVHGDEADVEAHLEQPDPEGSLIAPGFDEPFDEPDIEEGAALETFDEDIEDLEDGESPPGPSEPDFDNAGMDADPTGDETTPTARPDAETLEQHLDAIQARLAQLQDEFVGKLKYDAHKDHIIDKLHQELQEYKQDIVKKHILSIVLDVVKVADDIRKWLAYFRSLDVSQRDPVKLFRYLEAIPSDLEDIFYWQGVKPYVSREGVFNPATQRAIKKIPTSDGARDKTIAKSIRPGYEWEGKVIRQEMVAVYVYEDGKESVDAGNIDE